MNTGGDPGGGGGGGGGFWRQVAFTRFFLSPGYTLKPIFHCDAKPYALGTFALPNAKYTNTLVSFALGDTNFSRHPTQNPNASQRNKGCVGSQTQIFHVGHVHFMFFLC